MVRSAISAALVLLSSSGYAATAAPPDLARLSKQLHEEIRLEILARRAELIGEKLDAFTLDLSALRLDAAKLRRRADTARVRKDRDPFFPFDLGKFKDDVWRRALWMRERRWEAERLEGDVVPDAKLARKLDETLKAVARAAKELEDFDRSCVELQDAANAADRPTSVCWSGIRTSSVP
jgi:hypothetical protein